MQRIARIVPRHDDPPVRAFCYPFVSWNLLQLVENWRQRTYGQQRLQVCTTTGLFCSQSFRQIKDSTLMDEEGYLLESNSFAIPLYPVASNVNQLVTEIGDVM
jgi:hypothetical protein